MGHATDVTLAGFSLTLPGDVRFGAGTAGLLPDLVGSLGRRVLVVTGSDPTRHADRIAAIGERVESVLVFPASGEPDVATAAAVVEQARDEGVDVVVAIGGGSVIDLGKAAAMLLGNTGQPLDYLEVVGAGHPITRPSLPLVAVPSTAGTGSEVTANAVLASPEHGVKASLRSPLMLPRVAVVDPLLTMDCPPGVTAAAGMDALTQCIEPFVSRMANPVTDGWAREGIRRAATGLRRAFAHPDDEGARTDMALCSLLGGLALANAKLGAVHGFAGPIGGMAEVPHGLVCAALLAPVMTANLDALAARAADSPAIARYDEVAVLLTGRPDAVAADGVAWVRETTALLEVPGLTSGGLRRDQVGEAVQKSARASSMKGNPVQLTEQELTSALVGAM